MFRKLGALAATAGALALTALSVPPPAGAAADSNVWATVRNVTAQVNRTGGITVRGEVNCKAAVELWEEQNGALPSDAAVLVSLQWTAYQPIGRKAMVTASWTSDHMSPCYSVDNTDAFWPWATTHAGSTADFYVYSTGGRFTKGTVHIDVTMQGGYNPQTGDREPNVVIAPDPTGPGTPTDIAVEVFTAQQFDVRTR